MNVKRITYLSELYNIIGNYLHQHGDANILAMATHTNSDINNHTHYSISLENLNDDLKEIKTISINYHEILAD